MRMGGRWRVKILERLGLGRFGKEVWRCGMVRSREKIKREGIERGRS